jgi:hypothetical protein
MDAVRYGLVLLAFATFVGIGIGAPQSALAVDYDCADFSNQAEAQEYLLPGDPYRLDGDWDGVACEDLPCPCSTASSPAPPPVEPPPAEPLEATYWKPFEEAIEVEPRTILIGTGTLGGTFRIGSLADWSGWGESRASAQGFIRMRKCRPDCLRGGIVRRRAKVTLSRVRSICGQRRYMLIKIQVVRGPISTIGPYGVDCRGALTRP